MAGPASAMIFAAGLGTRMGALTRDRPKPLIRVGEATLLDHALAILRGAGIGRIVVNAHAHAGQVEAHLAEVAPEAAVSFESVLLETGGGLKAALPLLAPGPVLTLNADMVWRGPNPAAALAAAWDGARMGALLAKHVGPSGKRWTEPSRACRECAFPRKDGDGHHDRLGWRYHAQDADLMKPTQPMR